jgi:PIN domain nuclease of toxin-antitoxin system
LRLLLDTHAVIWWLAGDTALTRIARDAISDETNDVFVSAASSWEIATKHRIGKLPQAAMLAADIPGAIARQGFQELAITLRHAQIAGALPGPHRDPFDRMLIAQALHEQMTLVSQEHIFSRYGAQLLW